MPLPTVHLDDRRFDDIMAQARQLIPQYCPEWTDHNTSDPGIALLEVFAWMTDLMLFRVNQVPEKMFIKFLDMIGMQLDPPRAAVAPVTFYLAAAPSEPLTINAATEVATIRTEVTEAIVFSTESDLTIYPPRLKAPLPATRWARTPSSRTIWRGWACWATRSPSSRPSRCPATPSTCAWSTTTARTSCR